jgi:UDP-3-O-[3-hydroxymyristoyl] glucosamine N-acyltransferase
VVPLGLVGAQRQRAERDEDIVNIIGDGGHAKVINELLQQYGIGWFHYKDTVIAVGNNMARKKEVLANTDLRFPVLISKDALVSKDAIIGAGTIIMAGAVVQPGTRIGCHVIINTGATVDHDCVVEDYVHIAPGAHLCGDVHIGEGALVGVGVGIAPGCKIPAWSLVKARRLEIVPLQNHG